MLGKILGGRYELLEKTGGGGMAVVYKAKCHLLNRYVAVKILRPDLVENEEFVERFKRESQSAASLSHPNIVNMYDVGQENDIHYIVMEYVDGMTLKDYIRRKGRLSSEEAVRIACQICAGLHHAHENNIVHRDIKPQNILINKEGIAKVADFGIARAVTSSTVTMAGANVIGSVHYFSPEQARGGYVDKKSDIYSLGIVLYEMVTGVVPFEGDSAISVALKHIQEKVIPPVEINPNIPRSIQIIIERAIEKELKNRYDNAAEMLDDLNRALEEPDGAYVRRFVDDNMDTRIIPVINGHEKSSRKQGSQTEKVRKTLRQASRLGSCDHISHCCCSSFAGIFMVISSIFKQNFIVRDVPVPLMKAMTSRQALRSSGLVLVVDERRYDTDVEGIIFPKQGSIKVKSESRFML